MKVRTLRRFFGSSLKPSPYSAVRHKEMVRIAYGAVQAFYVVNLMFAYQSMYTMMDMYGSADMPPAGVLPLWPVWFVDTAHLAPAVNLASLGYMMTSLVAVIKPSCRLARLSLFLTALIAFALKYSFGTIAQKEIMWIWTSFLFVFLPSRTLMEVLKSRATRQYCLDIFAATQGIVLFFYFLTGFWKIVYGIGALALGNAIGIFSVSALSYIIHYQTLHEHTETFIGPLLGAYPAIGFPAFCLVVYIEFFAFWAWLRPALHRVWGVMLILLHIGTWLSLGVPFYLQSPLLAILLLQSPFAPAKSGWRKIIGEMPLIGLFRRLL